VSLTHPTAFSLLMIMAQFPDLSLMYVWLISWSVFRGELLVLRYSRVLAGWQAWVVLKFGVKEREVGLGVTSDPIHLTGALGLMASLTARYLLIGQLLLP
jgi:hypothetical protein